MGGKFQAREKHVEPAGELVAVRELLGPDGGAVRAKIYVAPGPKNTLVSTYEITGDGEPSSMEFEQLIGSLGGLKCAFRYLHCDVEEEGRQLRFPLGIDGSSGFEWFHVDPDMDTLCKRIIDIEICSKFALHEAVYGNAWRGEHVSHRDEGEDLVTELSAAAGLRYKIQQRVATLAKAGQSSSPLFGDDAPTVIPIQHANTKQPLVTDLLLRRDTGAEVQIGLWTPRLNEKDKNNSWLCEYRITGLDTGDARSCLRT